MKLLPLLFLFCLLLPSCRQEEPGHSQSRESGSRTEPGERELGAPVDLQKLKQFAFLEITSGVLQPSETDDLCKAKGKGFFAYYQFAHKDLQIGIAHLKVFVGGMQEKWTPGAGEETFAEILVQHESIVLWDSVRVGMTEADALEFIGSSTHYKKGAYLHAEIGKHSVDFIIDHSGKVSSIIVRATCRDQHVPYQSDYPATYTPPEITDIAELQALLSQADSVLAYNFNGNNGNSAMVECDALYGIRSKRLCPSAMNRKKLSGKQMKELTEITSDTSTYSGSWTGLAGTCFIPHMGFGFFKNDSLIAQVNVCFLCAGIRTRPYYHSDGLTKKGGDRYIALARKLGLKVVPVDTPVHY